jgi:NTE family protein
MPFGSEGKSPGVALALSGGGFRAVLFHCGALIRLNELGVLSRLDRVASVSGGSIVAGVMATRWSSLTPDTQGRFTNLSEEVIDPLRRFCTKRIDVKAVVLGAINPFRTTGDELADAYRDRLSLGVPLSTLPDAGPRFVFQATNYATGVSFRFSKPYCGDYRIGLIKGHAFDVATAVTASSAFPPVFSPYVIDTDPDSFEPVLGSDLYTNVDFRRRLPLADGGVYDNLALETVWRRFETVLVSDAGKPFEFQSEPSASLGQLSRAADIAFNQALALRKRALIDAFEQKRQKGTYWGINTLIGSYLLGEDALPVSPQATASLSAMRTRLSPFSDDEQKRLINFGYAVSDAALRAHTPALIGQASKGSWPYPDGLPG